MKIGRTPVVIGVVTALMVLVLILGRNVSGGPNPFVILGLVNGAVFGLVALGLVLVYKGTRVFNFAQGEFGTIAAYLLYLSIDKGKLGLPYGIGILIALAGTVVIGLGVERVIVRPLLEAPRVTLLVASIALALLFIGLEILIFRVDPLPLPTILSQEQFRGIEVFALTIDAQRLIGVGVLAAFGVGLGYFFSRTDLGLAVLATSQDAFATRVVGIGVERMSRFIWGSAAFLGAVAGLIYIPAAGVLLPSVMTSNILIPAFTGAVVGGMSSLPGAFVGGVVVGVVQAVAQWASGHFTVGDKVVSDIIPGVEQIAVFVVLLAVLLARPQGLLGREA